MAATFRIDPFSYLLKSFSTRPLTNIRNLSFCVLHATLLKIQQNESGALFIPKEISELLFLEKRNYQKTVLRSVR